MALHRPSSSKSQTRKKIAEDPIHTSRNHLKSHYTICRPRLMKAKSLIGQARILLCLDSL